MKKLNKIMLCGLMFVSIDVLAAEKFKTLSTTFHADDYKNEYQSDAFSSIAPVRVDFSYGMHEHTDEMMLITIKQSESQIPLLKGLTVEYSGSGKDMHNDFKIPLKPAEINCFYEGSAMVDFGLISVLSPLLPGELTASANIKHVYSSTPPKLECR